MSRPFFVLAPMDDVTDVVFRSIVAGCAPPDMYFTEFVNVDGLQSPGRPKLLHKLLINPKTDKYIVAQIWGKIPKNYQKTANELVAMGFHGVDINMGCPQKNEVRNGCCSALINDRDLAAELIRATKKGLKGRIPVSVKTRLGWNEIDLTWHEFLLNQGIDMLTVHLRTRKEMSAVPAHYDQMSKIVELRDKISPSTKLVLNGDVRDYPHGLELAESTGADGIMIGRGVFNDPYCFSADSPWLNMDKIQKIKLFRLHVDEFINTFGDRIKNYQSLRRFCKVYINGFDNASDLRQMVMHCNSAQEIRSLLEEAS